MVDLIPLSYLTAGLLEIVIPLSLGVYVWRRLGAEWRVFLVGGVMFLISLVRIPLNSAVSAYASNISGFAASLLLFVFPSLTAGVFEEGARYLAFRYLVRDHTVKNGVMYGAGHGGIESIFIAGLNVTIIGLSLAFSPDSLPLDYMFGIYSAPFWLPFVGLYERVLAMAIQIGLSVIVLQTFVRGDYRYLVAVVLVHFAVDFVMLMAISSFGIGVGEMVATVFAVAIPYTAWKLVRDSVEEAPGE
jgi:uncharacterized membrane protein YhfC